MDCKKKLPVEMMRNASEYEKQLSKMSPFEIKNKLIDLAYEHTRKAACQFLNAGRGNPNWVATAPREAFLLVSEFALAECRAAMNMPQGIAGIPHPKGIEARFDAFMQRHADHPGAPLLRNFYDYCVHEKGLKSEKLLFDWAEAAVGDQYPMPDRILDFCEPVIRDYLTKVLCCGQKPHTPLDLFATEGGTAAMCYVFNSLQVNRLLAKGDRIALMTPIFTPYIEIPELDRFEFNVTHIRASATDAEGLHTWQYPDEELDRLADPSIKVLFLVNPSNPPSVAIAPESLERLVKIVELHNPNLMIITDDVYASYVPEFQSLVKLLPHNTIGVYSFSKYFGATGWRLAVVSVAQDNIFDTMIRGLSKSDRADLHRRYRSIALDPDAIKFIDRMVADSRMVALNHTAGLSTPQQMMMSLMAASDLFDRDGQYHQTMLRMIRERLDALWEATAFTLVKDPLRAGYYSEIDLSIWAERLYGRDFAIYLRKNYNPLDFLLRLAKQTCIVLLNGGGFEGPKWSIRVSLANLTSEDYRTIGTAIRALLTEYAELWKKQ